MTDSSVSYSKLESQPAQNNNNNGSDVNSLNNKESCMCALLTALAVVCFVALLYLLGQLTKKQS